MDDPGPPQTNPETYTFNHGSGGGSDRSDNEDDSGGGGGVGGECSECKQSLPQSSYARRQWEIISGGGSGLCKECMDREFMFQQRLLLDIEKGKVETEKKKELEDLQLIVAHAKSMGIEIDERKGKKEIDENYAGKSKALQKDRDDLGKKNWKF